MPVEAKPLFRPDVLRASLLGFSSRAPQAASPKIVQWGELIRSGRIDALNERELLPDFLTDLFVHLLGYVGPPGQAGIYTLSREQHVEVEGQFADAVLGRHTAGQPSEFVVAVEGKGPKDPLERPHAGRRMSAVDQGYKYAVNLPCDWVVVTNIRQTRLYYKGANQQTYERFDTERLATDPAHLLKLEFLLGAERVLPTSGERCHLYDLLAASERAGKELTKAYYRAYAELREESFDGIVAANAAVSRPTVLTATQKLLDRLPVLDAMVIPDAVCEKLSVLGDYDYRPAHDAADAVAATAVGTDAADEHPLVDVDILGHIFEQSITDLERLRESLDAAPEEVVKQRNDRTSRRKREGVFYTPSFFTQYIVEQALGGVLRDRFESLRAASQVSAVAADKANKHSPKTEKVLDDPRAYNRDKLSEPQWKALATFWEDWQKELGAVRVLDPSCGSGAFLVEAFDQLHTAYEAANDRLADLRGARELFDLDRQILQHNLYGVDLNEEAVEICRLSLWIKTAERGKELTALDHSIRVGNSVVDDVAIHPRAFDWRSAFPQVFAAGGFDVIVGTRRMCGRNYLPRLSRTVRRSSSVTTGWRTSTFAPTSWACVCCARAVVVSGRNEQLLESRILRARATPFDGRILIESLVDFGHAKQIFEDAAVFPCILLARNTTGRRKAAGKCRSRMMRPLTGTNAFAPQRPVFAAVLPEKRLAACRFPRVE